MDRDALEGDPVGGTDDDDAARRLGATRPRAESGRGDRAGINDAGMRRDHDLGRDAPVRPRARAHVSDQPAQGRRLRRIEHSRDLGGMDFACRHGDALSLC